MFDVQQKRCHISILIHISMKHLHFKSLIIPNLDIVCLNALFVTFKGTQCQNCNRLEIIKYYLKIKSQILLSTCRLSWWISIFHYSAVFTWRHKSMRTWVQPKTEGSWLTWAAKLLLSPFTQQFGRRENRLVTFNLWFLKLIEGPRKQHVQIITCHHYHFSLFSFALHCPAKICVDAPHKIIINTKISQSSSPTWHFHKTFNNDNMTGSPASLILCCTADFYEVLFY